MKTYQQLSYEELVELHTTYHVNLRNNSKYYYAPRINRSKKSINILSVSKVFPKHTVRTILRETGAIHTYQTDHEGFVMDIYKMDIWGFFHKCAEFGVTYPRLEA